jgi:hypothetical protein
MGPICLRKGVGGQSVSTVVCRIVNDPIWRDLYCRVTSFAGRPVQHTGGGWLGADSQRAELQNANSENG